MAKLGFWKNDADGANNQTANTGYENANYQEEREPEYDDQNYNAEASVDVRVFRPKKFDEAPKIAASLLEGCLIFLNLEAADKVTCRRILDYMMGAIYILEGDLRPASSTAFIICPRNVVVSGDDPIPDVSSAKTTQNEGVKSENEGGFSAL